MLETVPILAILATAPPFDVASVEVDKASSCVHVIALDGAKEFAGPVFICGDDSGNVTIEADFADDVYLSTDTRQRKVESNDSREAASRVSLILDKLDPVDVQAGWGSCIFSTAGTVAGASSRPRPGRSPAPMQWPATASPY